jgi:hypothetical protein
LPKCSIPRQKIDIDKKARFHYQVGYWFRLIDASICWDRDEADTQFAIFAWLALKKQCLIFFLLSFFIFNSKEMPRLESIG